MSKPPTTIRITHRRVGPAHVLDLEGQPQVYLGGASLDRLIDLLPRAISLNLSERHQTELRYDWPDFRAAPMQVVLNSSLSHTLE